MLLLGPHVGSTNLLELFISLLDTDHLVLHLFLVTVASLQQFLRLLVGYIRQLLGSLLFEDEALDPILECRLLMLAISL
jgi:hypothetical protein